MIMNNDTFHNSHVKYYTIRITKIIANVLFYSFAIFIVVNFILSKVSSTTQAKYLGFEMRVITSNSMQGTIDKGTMIVSTRVDPSDIEVGDIITFKTDYYSENDEDYIITHRVIGISSMGYDSFTGEMKYYFQTKGDNTPDNDPYIVSEDDVIARYSFSIPMTKVIFNSIVPALKTPQGIFAGSVLLISLIGGIVCLNIMTKTFMSEYKSYRKSKRSQPISTLEPDEDLEQQEEVSLLSDEVIQDEETDTFDDI